MNREQKAVAIAEIASHIDEAHAIFAVDYRGISVPQVAELRGRLRHADATFKVVKNSLTERAADDAGAETLKDFLIGPTALTFVHGDVATAAKAIADYGRATQLLPFKGGLMDGEPLDVEQIRSLSRLPSREVLYGQLVGVVASPVGGLVRTLNALLGGLAVALGQVREKKESGALPAGSPPGPAADAAEADAPEAAESDQAEATEAGSIGAQPGAGTGEPAVGEPDQGPAEGEAGAEDSSAGQPAAGEPAAAETAGQPAADAVADEAEPAQPAQEDDNQADVSAESEDAETNPKED
jgi:large subunit ribosomal protein L10